VGGGRGAGPIRRSVGGGSVPDDGEDGRGLRSFLAADADPAAVIERRNILAADTFGRRSGRGLSDGEVGAESRRSLPQVSTTPAQPREFRWKAAKYCEPFVISPSRNLARAGCRNYWTSFPFSRMDQKSSLPRLLNLESAKGLLN
jgi:hypothetical protein